MQITEIKVHLMDEERLKAFVSVTFDNCFAVRNMKVVEGHNGLILCMPSRKASDESHKDLAHPITQEFRRYLEENILQAYQAEVNKHSGATQTDRSSAEQ